MYVKYPRTYHLPWSPGRTSDDKVLKSTDDFIGEEVVITEKMDGENTSLYSDGYTHARSIDSKYHESRNWLKAFWAERSYLLNPNCRICGENLYAKHSIHYLDLTSYFYGFSLWTNNWCNSWDETLQMFNILNITPVNVLYRGIYDEERITTITQNTVRIREIEGFVIRTTSGFHQMNFHRNVAKYVRSNHVQTDEHWMNQQIIKNGLKV